MIFDIYIWYSAGILYRYLQNVLIENKARLLLFPILPRILPTFLFQKKNIQSVNSIIEKEWRYDQQ